MRSDDSRSAGHRGHGRVRQPQLAARRPVHQPARLLHHQRRTDDLEVNLNGSWSTPITIGASGLPACVSVAGTTIIDFFYALDGSSYTLSYGTGAIPAAGQRNGAGPGGTAAGPQSYTLDAEGYVDVTVPAGHAANSSFTITLSANDGTTTQTEAVPVQIKASCKRHY